MKYPIDDAALTALRQATVWLEVAAQWDEKRRPLEDLPEFLRRRARVARELVEQLTEDAHE